MLTAGYFWVGIKGKSSDTVDASGVAIPNEHGK